MKLCVTFSEARGQADSLVLALASVSPVVVLEIMELFLAGVDEKIPYQAPQLIVTAVTQLGGHIN